MNRMRLLNETLKHPLKVLHLSEPKCEFQQVKMQWKIRTLNIYVIQTEKICAPELNSGID